jgi:hypothetical protein
MRKVIGIYLCARPLPSRPKQEVANKGRRGCLYSFHAAKEAVADLRTPLWSCFICNRQLIMASIKHSLILSRLCSCIHICKNIFNQVKEKPWQYL